LEGFHDLVPDKSGDYATLNLIYALKKQLTKALKKVPNIYGNRVKTPKDLFSAMEKQGDGDGNAVAPLSPALPPLPLPTSPFSVFFSSRRNDCTETFVFEATKHPPNDPPRPTLNTNLHHPNPVFHPGPRG